MENRRKKTIVIIILLFTIIVATAITSGKYIYNSVWNYYLKSKGFYFESDLLELNTKKNSLLKWDGSNIYFIMKNSLNSELISEYSISYKLTCTVLGEEADYIDCIINGTNSSVYNGNLSNNAICINNIDTEDVSQLTKSECELNGYTWYEEITSKKHYFNLELKDENKIIDEVSVKVTAESTSPYHKTLTGIFNINKVDAENKELLTNYQSFSEYDELSIVNTTSEDKCVSISFDSSNYLLDLDDSSIIESSTDSNDKVNKIKVKIGKSNSAIYTFYKTNSEKQYSINDFVVEEKEC